MSECTGPDCTHESHKPVESPQAVPVQAVPPPLPTAPKPRKKLTRNQRKAKRRKGIVGY